MSEGTKFQAPVDNSKRKGADRDAGGSESLIRALEILRDANQNLALRPAGRSPE